MRINEKQAPWKQGLNLAQVRHLYKSDADVVILNGFPVDAGQWACTFVEKEDEVVLIRRGEIPADEELAALMAARHTPGVAGRLRKACVGIAGTGGLGSNVAHALGRIGVGKLVVADFDVVEPSNLNRQAFRIEQIGTRKVEALAVDLKRINPLVQVAVHNVRLTPDNIPEVFAPCEVVVECFDRPDQKQMLVETVRLKLPHVWIVAASGLAGSVDSNLIRTRRIGKRLLLVGDGESAATFGRGLMAPRVMIAAGHQANAVVRLLLGEESQ